MSIVFDGPKADFIQLTYLCKDPIYGIKNVYAYPSTVDMTKYKVFYTDKSKNITIISAADVIINPDANKIKIADTPASNITLLGDAYCTGGIDFIDKQGQTGTIYVYDSFTVKNDSYYTKLYNTYITSENLLLGFKNPYPLKVSNTTYVSGASSVPITVDTTTIPVGDVAKLIGFFNNTYIGSTNVSGALTGYSSGRKGTVEILCKGLLQYSLASTGPWTDLLTIPVMTYNETITVYIRCGQVITTPVRYVNSVKVITTEAV